MCARSNCDGFSLIEMLVVLAMLGVILSIALPAMRSPRVDDQQSFAGRVALLAQSTRLAAITSNRNRSLTISVSDRVISSESRDETLQVPETLHFEVTYGQQQEHVSDVARILFYPTGGSTGGTMTFARGGADQIAVRINWLTGAISLQDEGRGP